MNAAGILAALAVSSWTYHLDGANPEAIAATGFDLAVVDYATDGTEENEFTPEEVRAMQRKPDGSRRLVLAYLSIGEAEDYRFYWKTAWSEGGDTPSWLDGENPDWPGNFVVRYWDPEWQKILFGSRNSYLDRILAAGFDGVWLDIVDAFEHYEDSRPEAASEMRALVRLIADYGRERRPGFLIVPQNGERLLDDDGYLALVDGIGKEDLFFGWEKDGERTPEDETREAVALLDRVVATGKTVVTVDYVDDPEALAEVYRRSRERGYVPYASVRALDRLAIHPGLDPASGGRGPAILLKTFRGRYRTSTAPPRSVRWQASTEYYTERVRYTEGDYGGPEGSRELTAEAFSEFTGALGARYGLRHGWEVGATVPAVAGHFEKDATDSGSRLARRVDRVGLGSIHLLAAHARAWGADDANVVRGEIDFGLPTDSRGEPFAGGLGSARLEATIEHSWSRLGVYATGAVNHYAEADVRDSETTLEAMGGVGLEGPWGLYAAGGAGAEGDIPRGEVSVEKVLRQRAILELSAGKDLAGRAAGFYATATIHF